MILNFVLFRRKAIAGPNAENDKKASTNEPPAPAEEPQNLYEKLGGEATIKAVVEEFYERVLGDSLLAPVFSGVDMANLKRHQALFISQALGGPKQYEGRDMKASHAGLGITGGQFDAVAGHLVGALQHFKVEQTDIDTIAGVVAPLKDQVVSAAAATPAPAPAEEPPTPAKEPPPRDETAAPPQNLYEKLGGETTIKAVVEEFYERVLADGNLAPIFKNTDMANLKRHQALFISQVLGGPKEYDGRTLYQSHKDLAVTDGQFDAVAGHLSATLESLHVDAQDIATILGEIAPLRRDIVMTHFKRWLRGG